MWGGRLVWAKGTIITRDWCQLVNTIDQSVQWQQCSCLLPLLYQFVVNTACIVCASGICPVVRLPPWCVADCSCWVPLSIDSFRRRRPASTAPQHGVQQQVQAVLCWQPSWWGWTQTCLLLQWREWRRRASCCPADAEAVNFFSCHSDHNWWTVAGLCSACVIVVIRPRHIQRVLLLPLFHCQMLCMSVSLLVTTMNCAKTAWPVEMLFKVLTQWDWRTVHVNFLFVIFPLE